jgi:hypothetical protein
LIVLFSAGVLIAIDSYYTLDKSGNRVQPASCSDQSPWVTVGTFAYAGAEPTTPDATHRYDTAFEAVSKVQIYTIPARWNSILLRQLSDSVAADDASVYDVFLTRGEDDFWTRICTIKFTCGEGLHGDSGYLVADTVAISNEKWIAPINDLSPTGDYQALVEIDVRGFNRIGFVPTTLVTKTFIQATGY